MSIAAQLKVHALGQDRREAVKSRASFLFDPKVAADTDSQTIFNLSKNGLTELIKLDQTFLAFENTLFARVPESSYFSTLTPDARKKLDSSIACFLRVLSPYFLNKSSHKCLEFLIRCYHIHENHVENVIACVLPYHETALFPRMLKCLNLDRVSFFNFLKKCKQENTALARGTLVRRCIVDPAMLQFVCEMGKPTGAVSGLKEYLMTLGVNHASFVNKAAISFYTVTIVDVLTTIDKITDEVVNSIVPYIVNGIYSVNAPEYQTAAYMVLTKLCDSTFLRPRVLADILTAICKNIPHDATPQALQYPLLCVFAILKSQASVLASTPNPFSNIPVFPQNAFASLLKIQNLVDALVITDAEYDISSFLWPFLQSLVSSFITVQSLKDDFVTKQTGQYIINEKSTTIFVDLISKIDVTTHYSTLVQWILAVFTGPFAHHQAIFDKDMEKMVKSAIKKEQPVTIHWTNKHAMLLTRILRQLDQLHPDLMNEALEKIVDSLDTSSLTPTHNPFTTLVFINNMQPSSSDMIMNAKVTHIKAFIETPYTSLQSPKLTIVGLIGVAFKNTRHEVLVNSETTLLLSFSHHKSSVRLDALERLDELLDAQLEVSGLNTQKTSLDMNDDDDDKLQVDDVMEDITLDDDLSFLEGPLMSDDKETTISLKPSSSTPSDIDGENVDATVSISLDDAADIIVARFKDEDIRVISKILSLKCLQHNLILSNDLIVSNVTILLDKLYAVLGLGSCVDSYSYVPQDEDDNHIHSINGIRTILPNIFSYLAQTLTRIHTTMTTNSSLQDVTDFNELSAKIVPYFTEIITVRSKSTNISSKMSVARYNSIMDILPDISLEIFNTLVSISGGVITSTPKKGSRSKKNQTKTDVILPIFASIGTINISDLDIQDRNNAIINVITQNIIANPASLIAGFTHLLFTPFTNTPSGYSTTTQRFALSVISSIFKTQDRPISLVIAMAQIVLYIVYQINQDQNIDKSQISKINNITSNYISNDVTSLLYLINVNINSMLNALVNVPLGTNVPYLSWGIAVTDAMVHATTPAVNINMFMSQISKMFLQNTSASASYSYATTHAEIIARTFILSLPYGSQPSSIDANKHFIDNLVTHVPKDSSIPSALLLPIINYPVSIYDNNTVFSSTQSLLVESYISSVLKRVCSFSISEDDMNVLLPTLLSAMSSSSKIIRNHAVSVIESLNFLDNMENSDDQESMITVVCRNLRSVSDNICMDANNINDCLASFYQNVDANTCLSPLSETQQEKLTNMFVNTLQNCLPPSTLLQSQNISSIPLCVPYLNLSTNLINILCTSTSIHQSLGDIAISILNSLSESCDVVECISITDSYDTFIKYTFAHVSRIYLEKLIKSSTLTLGSNDNLYPLLMKCLSNDLYISYSSTLINHSGVIPMIFSIRDVVINNIDGNLFKYLGKTQQQELFDMLLTVNYASSEHVELYHSKLTKPIAYPLLAFDSVMEILYKIRLPVSLFSKYIILSKGKNRNSIDTLFSVGYDQTYKALSTLNTILANEKSYGIKSGYKLLQPFFQVLSAINTITKKTPIEEKDNDDIMNRLYALQHVILSNIYLICITDSESSFKQITDSDIATIMFILTDTLCLETKSSIDSVSNLVSATLESPQRVQTRDSALQLLSSIAIFASQLTIPVIYEILNNLMLAMTYEEKIASSSNATFPSLISTSPSNKCSSIEVVNGSILDVTLRTLRSIIGPSISQVDNSKGELVRTIANYIENIDTCTYQVLLCGLFRYITSGEFINSDATIYYSAPLDTDYERELDKIIDYNLIAGGIAISLLRVYTPSQISVISVDYSQLTSENTKVFCSNSKNTQINDAMARILYNFDVDIQVSVLAQLIPIIYSINSSNNLQTNGSIIDNVEYYVLQEQFSSITEFACNNWKIGTLQFIQDICNTHDFRFNITSLSRDATHIHTYGNNKENMDAIDSDVEEDEDDNLSDAQNILESLGTAFTLMFSRLLTACTYSEAVRDAESKISASGRKFSYYRSVVHALDNIVNSIASLLATVHFTTVFKSIFQYTLYPEEEEAKLMLSLSIDNVVYTASRSFSVKRLLVLLIQRIRVERERVHAEAFIHLVNGDENSQLAKYRNYVDILDDDDDEEFEDMEDEEVAQMKKKQWIVELQRREAALLGVIPVLSTQLFTPFLMYYNNSKDEDAEGTYNAVDDLQNLQVAMLCVDELCDVACLMLAPLSAPAAAIAALSGMGNQRPVIQLPKNILKNMLDVYSMVMKVASVSATETFSRSNENTSWPILLSSSLLCMGTLSSRTGVQSLKYFNQLTPLSLAIMDKVAYHISYLDKKDEDKENNVPVDKKSKNDENINLSRDQVEMLQLSALSVLETLLRTFPSFLSPYLNHILSVLLHTTLPEQNAISASDLRFTAALESSVNDDTKNMSNAHENFLATGGLVSTCLQAIANYVSPRVLIAPVFESWNMAISRGTTSTSRLLALVARICMTMNSISDESMRQNSMDDEDEDDESDSMVNYEDDILDFSDDDERNISNYVNALFQFFMRAVNLRKEQSNPEEDGFNFENKTVVPVVTSAQVHTFKWSVNQTALLTPLSHKKLLWTDLALTDTEVALVSAFMEMIYKLDELHLRQIFTSLVDWVQVQNNMVALKDDKEGVSQCLTENLPQILPFFRIIHQLTEKLKHIFLPYLLDILDTIVAILNESGKGTKDERRKLKAITKASKKKTNGKRMADDEDEEDEDDNTFLRKFATLTVWRAQASTLVVETMLSALRTDTMMARGSNGQTVAVIAKDDMDRTISALTNHISIGYTVRLNIPPVASGVDKSLIYPEFVDSTLVPCLAQLSVHLAYSNPALWDTLVTRTMLHSTHSSPIVRFAALSTLHIYIKRNSDDFLLLLPKIVTYISELMQDTNILVEKLAQDVIKTIEKMSGESLSDYLK